MIGSAAAQTVGGRAILAENTNLGTDRRDIVVLGENPSLSPPTDVIVVDATQASPYGEPILNGNGGLVIQVTATDLQNPSPTDTFGQGIEFIWGSATDTDGSLIGGPQFGATGTIAPTLGFTAAGEVFLENSGFDNIQKIDPGGSSTVVITEGDALGTGVLGFIGSVRTASTDQLVFTASIVDGVGETNAPGLFIQNGSGGFDTILDAGDAIAGLAGATVARSDPVGSTFFTATFDSNYAVLDADRYAVIVGVDTDGDLISDGDAPVLDGSLLFEGGNPLIGGGTLTGARSGVEIIVSSGSPPVTEIVDEVWERFIDVDLNAAGDWIVAGETNVDGNSPDPTDAAGDVPVAGDYLVFNGAIDTTVVDPRLEGNEEKDLEAVALNEDGDFAFLYGDALYINNELILDTNDNGEFAIEVENASGGFDLVTLNRVFDSLALTDRTADGEVTAFFNAADDADSTGAFGDNVFVVASTFLVEEFLLGDLDMDGDVDVVDLDLFADSLLSGGADLSGDLDGDNDVDVVDLDLFADALLAPGASGASLASLRAAAVPEPASAAVFVGVAGVAVGRRRGRREARAC